MLNFIFSCNLKSGSGSETEVTWEDQQNINKFGRLNNRYHELEDEIKIAKVHFHYHVISSKKNNTVIKFVKRWEN